jgi:hypothetical protein
LTAHTKFAKSLAELIRLDRGRNGDIRETLKVENTIQEIK